MPLFNQSIRRKIVGIALGLIVLMLVTYVPELSLWLPRLMKL